MSLYLYGLVSQNTPLRLGPIGFDVETQGKSEVLALPCQEVAAVVSDVPWDSFEGLSKEQLVHMLLAHQLTLETIMKGTFVLPYKFGTFLRDDKEVFCLLSQHQNLFQKWLNEMCGHSEINVVVRCDPKTILREIAETDPEIQELKRQFVTSTGLEQASQKLSIGIQLSEKLKKWSQSYANEILDRMKIISGRFVNHDVMNDEMIMNTSFLISKREEATFFNTLEDLDKVYQERLHFKCIGPLPPYSFACVTLRRFDPQRVKWALTQFGLKGKINDEAIKKAYKYQARQCHPDIQPMLDQSQFEKMNEAYELLTDYYQGGCQPLKVALIQRS